MGSGTYSIDTTSYSSFSSTADLGHDSLGRRLRGDGVEVEEEQQRQDKDMTAVAVAAAAESQDAGISSSSSSPTVCQPRRTPNQLRHKLRFGRECLMATFVLIVMYCDMVRANQYTVIEAAMDEKKSGVHPGQEMSESINSQMSESEMQRIQDLVLRGLNITRIPRPSEVSVLIGRELR